MGVPAFFRWLCKKYASVIVHCEEEKAKEVHGVAIPVDCTKPNPNGVEFDNLYLDMNGIIHPCTHPEDRPAPQTEDEMMIAIFECIDRIFSIVRPRKLLYMAIDGVAPRAKMNQQRSRRFRASKENEEKINEMQRIFSDLQSKGILLPPQKPKEAHFDSNCITPGTPFMHRLSRSLHYYIYDRLHTNPAWKNIEVILSDSSCPGEATVQLANPDHNPNTHHVLCGADADLIMLGLATHEPYFTIIREEFKPQKARPCDICGQLGHEMKDCVGGMKTKSGEYDEILETVPSQTNYIFVRLSVLREYLEREMYFPNLSFSYDLERVIDDWVFMCFFVGNDFLPHLPSLEIREGAIDRLITLYKRTINKTQGYLTCNGTVNLNRVQIILQELGKVEDEIFRQRQARDIAFKERERNQKKNRMDAEGERPSFLLDGPVGKEVQVIHDAKQTAQNIRRNNMNGRQQEENNTPASKKGKIEDDLNVNNEPLDEIRLWEEGFKDRYYLSKFDMKSDNIGFRSLVASEYALGLSWVLRYYYQGCGCWKWFFPYHYAPFASDFMNLSKIKVNFPNDTKPFTPLEQLMSVFPAASRAHIPESFAHLMTSKDSPIIDFYPTDFKIDLNGKKFAWQGVALLPFVCEKRLKKAMKPYYRFLTEEEVERNSEGDNRLYITNSHRGFEFLSAIYENELDSDTIVKLDTKLFNGMAGQVLFADDYVPLGSVRYRDPVYPENFLFLARRLSGVIDPPRVLKPQNLNAYENHNWRPIIGMVRSSTQASLDVSGHRKIWRSMSQPTPYIEQPISHQPYVKSMRLHGFDPSRFPFMSQGDHYQSNSYQVQKYNPEYRHRSSNSFNRRPSYQVDRNGCWNPRRRLNQTNNHTYF